MTNLELVLNMLAEASTTEISKDKEPLQLSTRIRKWPGKGEMLQKQHVKNWNKRQGKKLLRN
jgi:hypothetical protein